MVRTRSSSKDLVFFTAPPPKSKRGRTKRCFPNSAHPIAKILSPISEEGEGSKRLSELATCTSLARNFDFDFSVAEEAEGPTLSAKPSGRKLVSLRRLLNDCDRVSGFTTAAEVIKSTIQPSEVPLTKTQHEKEVSHEAIQNFQLATEGVVTEQAADFLSVPKPVIPDPMGTEEMDLFHKLDEENSSQGGNDNATSNIINHGPGEHSSNGLQGTRLSQKTTSLNFTEIADRIVNDELDDEVDSFVSSTTLVEVGSYKVKPKYEVLARHILDKFGDIAASCKEESVAFRSLFIENVCQTIQKMDTKIDLLKQTDVDEMMSSVILLESQDVDIGWLKTRLIKITEAAKAIQILRKHRQSPAVSQKYELQKMKNQLEVYKQEMGVKRAKIEVKRAEIEAKKAEIEAKKAAIEAEEAAIEAEEAAIEVQQAEIEDLGNKLYDVKCNISVAQDESKKVSKEISESRAKLRYIVELGSLVAGFK